MSDSFINLIIKSYYDWSIFTQASRNNITRSDEILDRYRVNCLQEFNTPRTTTSSKEEPHCWLSTTLTTTTMEPSDEVGDVYRGIRLIGSLERLGIPADVTNVNHPPQWHMPVVNNCRSSRNVA